MLTASVVLQSKLLFLSWEIDKSDLTRRFALMLYASARHSPSRCGVPFGATMFIETQLRSYVVQAVHFTFSRWTEQ